MFWRRLGHDPELPQRDERELLLKPEKERNRLLVASICCNLDGGACVELSRHRIGQRKGAEGVVVVLDVLQPCAEDERIKQRLRSHCIGFEQWNEHCVLVQLQRGVQFLQVFLDRL